VIGPETFSPVRRSVPRTPLPPERGVREKLTKINTLSSS
jgi:hypothetical protein